jgi:hypothetical protein
VHAFAYRLGEATEALAASTALGIAAGLVLATMMLVLVSRLQLAIRRR